MDIAAETTFEVGKSRFVWLRDAVATIIGSALFISAVWVINAEIGLTLFLIALPLVVIFVARWPLEHLRWANTSHISITEDEMAFRRRFWGSPSVSKATVTSVHVETPPKHGRLLVVDLSTRRVNIRLPLKNDHQQLVDALARETTLPFMGARRVVPFRSMKKMSRAQFKGYLADTTPTSPADLDDVVAWLREHPTYLSDGEHDYWSLPSEFEAKLAGDCDDHAVWAWAKLHHLGYEPEFVIGWTGFVNASSSTGYHAWVRYTEEGQLMSLEATTKHGDMVVPWASAKGGFDPHYVVDASLRCWYYPDAKPVTAPAEAD